MLACGLALLGLGLALQTGPTFWTMMAFTSSLGVAISSFILLNFDTGFGDRSWQPKNSSKTIAPPQPNPRRQLTRLIHDLRNPMTSMKLASEYLRMEQTVPSKKESMLDMIDDDLLRLEHILNEASRTPDVPGKTELANLLRGLINEMPPDTVRPRLQIESKSDEFLINLGEEEGLRVFEALFKTLSHCTLRHIILSRRGPLVGVELLFSPDCDLSTCMGCVAELYSSIYMLGGGVWFENSNAKAVAPRVFLVIPG
ncbi:MAG: histidine kinase dimerization/phospho-acceptor domain-containing protein [Mangrovicoccus sp.]